MFDVFLVQLPTTLEHRKIMRHQIYNMHFYVCKHANACMYVCIYIYSWNALVVTHSHVRKSRCQWWQHINKWHVQSSVDAFPVSNVHLSRCESHQNGFFLGVSTSSLWIRDLILSTWFLIGHWLFFCAGSWGFHLILPNVDVCLCTVPGLNCQVVS